MTQNHSGSILVVDDQESTRYLMGAWLRRAGYSVVEATNGNEGMAKLSENGVELAVLDVHLPDMSGFELCEWIKQTPATSSIPVIHVSATAVDVADRTLGIARGADAYFAEPVDREELLAMIGALLRSSRARRRSENLVNLLERLSKTTIRVHAATSLEQILNSAVQGASDIFSAPAALALFQEATALAASAGPGQGGPAAIENPSVLRDLLPVLDDPRAAGELAEMLIPGHGRHEPITTARIRSRRGETLGRVVIVDQGLLEDEEAGLLLNLLAQTVSVAVQNIRVLEAEKRIALTLQKSLLPDHLDIPGLEVAVRYEAGSDQLAVGGDFFEAFVIDDRHVGLAIGDVVGHSLAAATVMAEIRHTLRTHAIEGLDPSDVLVRVDKHLDHFHPDMTATMAFAVLDTGSGIFRLSNAGHLPPLIVGPGGSASLISPGTMLGVGETVRDSTEFYLGEQNVIVMVTDGLVERRGTPLDKLLSRMAEVALENYSDLEVLCDELIRRVGPGPSGFDDLAILAIRRAPMPDGKGKGV